MRKVIKAVQKGTNRWQRKVCLEFTRDEVISCAIIAIALGWILSQAVLS